ncbi:UDP-4-amino-4,6-dideoxy-N-acetyl-beta-L-altrosamine transaminase [Candidatus Micrarchaeota archaeon CG_4_10_14_0_2_um_filter_60_11]|nr:MAG: UDP-4-amino-4,6-dideoxy-N-acetyl-beta-L-altrosamine transaminase [Candidatus Micrarchaeota archaeon CG1_02_60_51]PIN96073.1 MAG: UDP-4-amino-4,6-dideoxy-N-acetyl-beta-L-altrosamine transaminase [Candidatus Micrarchaeota archaeon CG10_big_fil_rev_8_21_14_0_10_60_32]PIO01579.1 MAG: UDP-4-amino-4,6-dideoxy-N-acetyl-beta-L-altrosamine transaminase [Candidatus Micrarchaeota archaeon CG09_land_8_20_14_0_10_60_16]PIY91708.1 MAG: UDP-4-amino-4,6-dideoxy-N-acetyl-beta-L-altrosamine transaminase [
MAVFARRKEMLPYFRPYLNEEEVDAAAETIRSGWLCMGPKVIEFEKAFGKYVGCRHAVAVSSCTAALHLSLIAQGVGPGDEVITTPYTFVSTVNVIEHVGAKPVFADIDYETFNIDPEAVRKKVTKKTKAIIPVHFAGQSCAMDGISEIAEDKGVAVIEDAAHAAGTKYKGRRVGSQSHLACFSFYVNKNITTAEGGMITTDNAKLAERLGELRLQGMSRDAWKRYSAKNKWRYDVAEPGWKYNLTDLQASIGLVQLKRIEQVARKRAAIADRYNEAFEGIDGLKTPSEAEPGHCWHLYPLRVRGMARDRFVEKLSEENVGTGVHFIPVHLFSYYRKKYGFSEGRFPIAEKAFGEEVSLPLYAGLSKGDVEYVVGAVRKIMR